MRTVEIAGLAVFAEDIREEIGETYTIVGIMPDTLQVPVAGGFLPKLAVYVRVSVELAKVKADSGIKIRLYQTDGSMMIESDTNSEALQSAAASAREQGSPIATLFTVLKSSLFPIVGTGNIHASYQFDDLEETLAGFLRVTIPSAV